MKVIHKASVLTLFWFCLSINTASSNELTGVEPEEVITLSLGGEMLRLKGSSQEKMPAQSLYIGGLYLQQNQSNETVQDILQSTGPKRFVIYCQESSVKPEKLIRALNLGIVSNHTKEELVLLQPALDTFNQIWNTEIKQGDKVWIDYLPEKGTVVTINNQERGLIPGKDFYNAFLKSWIGEKPINRKIKRQLLGTNSN